MNKETILTMDKETILTIDNYNGKKITFKIPSGSSIEIFREASFIEIFEHTNTFSNVDILIEGNGIAMEVERLEEV